MLVDYHVHPDFSADARGSIADYCRQALLVGVAEICFTPHYHSEPRRSDNWARVGGQLVPMKSDWLDKYIVAIEEARREFPTLRICAGLEVTYFPELEDELGKIIGEHSLDFVIGSVHCLNHISLMERADSHVYFTGRTAREVCTSYFRVMRLAVNSGLFDAIAHLDVFKKFGRGFYGSDLNQAVYGLSEPVLEEMAKREMALEVNSGGWRHSCREAYPSQQLLGLANDYNIRRITLGSDAHEVHQLADGIGKGVMIAQEAGFGEYCTYEKRRPVSRPFSTLKTRADNQM